MVDATKVSQAIPLAATLRVELDSIVVLGSRGFVYDLVPERLAVIARDLRLVQVPIQGDAGAHLDLACRRFHHFRGEKVEAPELVVVSKQTPRVPRRPVFPKREGFERWNFWHCLSCNVETSLCLIQCTENYPSWIDK